MNNKVGLTPEGEKHLLNLLEQREHVYITFLTKRNTEREMHCSRAISYVPQDGKDDPKLNHESIIAVYDYQNSAWRSFRKDSVLYYEAD